MSTAELLASIMAFLALVISIITAYLTLLQSFSAKVYPGRRPILTQVDDIPCLALVCECINIGAKAGIIEDIVVTINHKETGSEFKLAALLTKNEFNILEPYRATDFRAFNSIMLGPKERRSIVVVFKPIMSNFQPLFGNYTIKVSYRYSYRKHWYDSNCVFSITLNEVTANTWRDPTIGKSQQVEADEMTVIRKKFLGKV